LIRKALFNRGFAYDKLGQFDLAIKDYTRSIEIDSSNAYAYYNRAISYDKKGEIERTIEDFTKAIKLIPTKADFYLNRGYSYRKLKEYELAINDYTQVLKLEPKCFKALYNRGLCYEKQTDYLKAEKDLMDCCSLEPNNLNVFHHLAGIQEKLGGDKLQCALENFSKVINSDPEFIAAYNGIGLVQDKRNNFEEAIKYFNKAIELDQKNPIYWHNRGCSYRNMNKYNSN